MEKKAEDLTQRLRSDILEGAFSPGERLTELALAGRYTVGRGAVRAALVELRAEGLVDIEANRGAVVRKITLNEAIEIAEARRALESLVARRAAVSDDIAAKDQLQAITMAMRQAVGARDHYRYTDLNREFHRRIWGMSGHQVAGELISNLRDRSAHHQFRLATMPGRLEESLQQHVAIAEAIASGDGEAAEKAMGDHLGSVVEILRRWSDIGVNI